MLNYLNGVNLNTRSLRNRKNAIVNKISNEKIDNIANEIFRQAEIGFFKKKKKAKAQANAQKNTFETASERRSILETPRKPQKYTGKDKPIPKYANPNSIRRPQKYTGKDKPIPKYANPNKPLSQVEKSNIMTDAIDKANSLQEKSPLTIIRLKKQAVIDLNRKNFEEQGEPIVSEIPLDLLETANDKFDQGLEEIQAPENLNIDEADSDQGGEDMGWIWQKGGLKKAGQAIKKAGSDARATIKYHAKNAGRDFRKLNPLSVLARNSFLLLLKFNVFKLRTKLAQGYKKNPQKIKNFWEGTWGGNMNVLLNNLKVNKIGMIGEPVTIATALVSASGVVVAAIELLKSLNIKVDKNENASGNESDDEEEDKESDNVGAIEFNADMGVYYPTEIGRSKGVNPKKKDSKRDINKGKRADKRADRKAKRDTKKTDRKTKRTDRQDKRKDKRDKNQKAGTTFFDKFQDVTDKTTRILDASGKVINTGKGVYKNATGDYVDAQGNQQPKPDAEATFKDNSMLYAGIGAAALLGFILLKKKK